MSNAKEEFKYYQAQTTAFSSAFEVDRAEGSYIYGKDGRKYLDLVAGVSACNLGHNHPEVIDAIKAQLDKHMHVMVYGEFVQDTPLQLAKHLASLLPAQLETTYFVNSGTEAIEASIKLAKRYTGRYEIVSAHNSYHGNTQGTMSVSGREQQKRAFRPLIPGTRYIRFNEEKDLAEITTKTAAVVLETIQGGAGFIVPKENYLIKVSECCTEVGALLILDEIQPGFGRTGKLFGFEHYDVVPDILVIGKAMASGMPIGALVSSPEIMSSLSHYPKLGHITTFGGHPVNCAAALSTLKVLSSTNLMESVEEKEELFHSRLKHPKVKGLYGKGLMLALELETEEMVIKLVEKAMHQGLILFLLLYHSKRVRISPPLTISIDEINKACDIILQILDEL